MGVRAIIRVRAILPQQRTSYATTRLRLANLGIDVVSADFLNRECENGIGMSHQGRLNKRTSFEHIKLHIQWLGSMLPLART